jgi:hypothetical protein
MRETDVFAIRIRADSTPLVAISDNSSRDMRGMRI